MNTVNPLRFGPQLFRNAGSKSHWQWLALWAGIRLVPCKRSSQSHPLHLRTGSCKRGHL